MLDSSCPCLQWSGSHHIHSKSRWNGILPAYLNELLTWSNIAESWYNQSPDLPRPLHRKSLLAYRLSSSSTQLLNFIMNSYSLTSSIFLLIVLLFFKVFFTGKKLFCVSNKNRAKNIYIPDHRIPLYSTSGKNFENLVITVLSFGRRTIY